MAFCHNCGCKLAEGAQFCGSCGTHIKANSKKEPSLDAYISTGVVLDHSKQGSSKVKVYLEHIDKTVSIDVPNSVTVGQKIRLLGMGHTSHDGKSGNAYVQIEQVTYKPLHAEETITCNNCGKEIPNSAKFCLECGSRIDVEDSGENKSQRRIEYDGAIYKCPNCGDIMDAYESVCLTCGYERRGAKATNSVQELSRKLQLIEESKHSKKETEALKINLIRSFPIPNAKEDIMEFAILSISNVNPSDFNTLTKPFALLNLSIALTPSSKESISNAWLSKFDQAYQKGKLMFGNCPELENVYSLYISKKKSISFNKNAIWIFLCALILITYILSFVNSCRINNIYEDDYLYDTNEEYTNSTSVNTEDEYASKPSIIDDAEKNDLP